MLTYLLRSIAHHLAGFFRDWYGRSFYFAFSKAFDTVRYLEQILALKVTLQFWFQPLYQDYSFLGYFLGLPARTARIIAGIFIYALVLVAFALAYIVWAALLPLLIYKLIQ